jgi:RNA polymerase sigma factor (sigma-70 family)
MNWERIEPWEYIVSHVADEYHKKYTMVDREDIRQSLYEWFVSHPRKLTEWEVLGKKSAQNLLYRSLRNQALDYCQQWKAKSIGYELSDLYFYEPAVVEALLPAVMRGDVTEAPVLNLGMPGKPSAPAEGGNMMAMMIEVDYAFWKLPKDDRKVLFLRYAESMDFGDIAKELDMGTEDAVRMRHKRAIRKLINKIGGFKPFRDYDDVPQEDSGVDSAGSTQSDSPYES